MAKPKYRVVDGQTFYHNLVMHKEGDEVEYDGEPGHNLDPLNPEAKKAKERAAKGQPAVAPLDASERRELEELRALKLKKET